MCVRFGNVLDFSGSMVPIFRWQISQGAPVTFTDPEMRHYFMIIHEAVQLDIQTREMGAGGEIFVLHMGEQLTILEADLGNIKILLASGNESDFRDALRKMAAEHLNFTIK